LEQERSQEAKDFLSKTDEYDLFMTDFSLHSIGLLLFRREQYQVFHQFLNDMILNAGIMVLHLGVEDMEDVLEVALRFGLDFDDAYQYVAAEKHELPIISFDADFEKTERGRKNPGEILE
jgi:predicted nucleic acid-binding protein